MPQLTIRRIPEAEYKALRIAAATTGQSIESYCREAIRAAVLRLASTANGAPVAALLDGAAKGARASRARA